ncbi:ABC transporter [Endozoicomonas montiporae]|uniref:ABC transporter n=2 Tax=Endozoicomonas montiporae TaxID=1027273 RepID=A0A081N0S0_9GAMM|nr:ABC transporter ATP-binding protein [Endozoicomonas montiporae]AMO54524.1 iron(III)-siderophore transporter ATP binding protein [Endozoicomonas montiporae CL-33]KEQ12043.1 ABC transporter [Endozoicomonas montiporae]
MSRPVLQSQKLSLGYGDKTIINNIDLDIPEGKITTLIGANGCGKSTLLRSMARLLKPKSGCVLLDGKEVFTSSTKEIAKRLAILPQGPVAPEGMSVMQLVRQGRYPHQSWLKQWSEEDERCVVDALKATNMTEFAERTVDSLSGGQRQRAWIAMTLAQNTPVILLDEPTTYLDMSHQVEILDLLFDLNRDSGRTVVMVLHDMNLACRYSDNIVAVKNGEIYANGQPETVMTAELVEQVFGLDSQIIPCPMFGTPTCVPVGKGRRISTPLHVVESVPIARSA